MSKKKFNQDRYEWQVPKEMTDALQEEGLQIKDKIEIVMAFYSRGHGGNTPSMDDIAMILGIAKSTTSDKIKILINEKRVIQRDGKFFLKNSIYTHPIVRENFIS